MPDAVILTQRESTTADNGSEYVMYASYIARETEKSIKGKGKNEI